MESRAEHESMQWPITFTTSRPITPPKYYQQHYSSEAHLPFKARQDVKYPTSQSKTTSDESEGRKKRPRAEIGDSKTGQTRFACPYHKREPHKPYVDRRFKASYKHCAREGYEDTHRVKEHLYRRHKAPVHCERCYSIFNSEENLQAHRRDPAPCDIADRPESVDGITPKQEKLLRSRARTGKSEEEKWYDVYSILFPGEMIPLPYQTSPSEEALDMRLEGAELLQSYTNTQLPMHVMGMVYETVGASVSSPDALLLLQRLPAILDASLARVHGDYLGAPIFTQPSGSLFVDTTNTRPEERQNTTAERPAKVSRRTNAESQESSIYASTSPFRSDPSSSPGTGEMAYSADDLRTADSELPAGAEDFGQLSSFANIDLDLGVAFSEMIQQDEYYGQSE